MMNSLQKLFFLLAALACTFTLSAQNQQEEQDSLVSLLSAKSMQLIEKDGVPLRKVIGPARFFHNNTYLLCDTALWNVDEEMIHAIGNVRIMQNETVLTSDLLDYDIARDLAMFRGSLVQLQDKDLNTLRTNDLDYNTRDSIAYFVNGAALRDKDGQLIESIQGEYNSLFKTFSFRDNVEMFTDSVFIKTDELVYYTEKDSVTFGTNTNSWKDEFMMSSEGGWYARLREQFFFEKQVHGQNPDKEVWCDSLYYNRLTNNVEMLGRVQLIDSLRNVTAMGGHMIYIDSLQQLKMFRNPVAVGLLEDQKGVADSVWFGADTLIYRAIPRFKVSSGVIEASRTRMSNLESDAVTTYRQKAAQAAAEAAKKKAEEDPNYRHRQGAAAEGQKAGQTPPKRMRQPAVPEEEDWEADTWAGPVRRRTSSPADYLRQLDALYSRIQARRGQQDSVQMPVPLHLQDSLTVSPDSTVAGVDSLAVAEDSLSAAMDSLGTALDSTALDSTALDAVEAPEEVDSTNIGFFTGIKNVRVFKSDMQVLADSLQICDLDSLVRLYKRPVIWDQVTRQYASDSIYILTRNSKLDKANLLSNAFIIVEEDTLCFDQIRSAEMMAYFDSTSALRRFDALGGVNAIFYLKEDTTYATVNKTESKMMSAVLKGGELDKVYYFEASGTDAFPLAQMKKEETILKGFEWMPEKRPVSRFDISRERIRSSQKREYARRPRNRFIETDRYFPGYINSVYESIEQSNAAKRRHKQWEAARKDSLERVRALEADSLALVKAQADSLAKADSLAQADSLALVDSLAVDTSLEGALDKPVADSLDSAVPGEIPDSLSVGSEKQELTPAELEKQRKKEEKEKQARIRAEEKAEKARIREEQARLRKEKKEKHWAELDSLDAMKDQIKAEKKREKIREKKRKALVKALKQARKDQALLDKYILKYQKQQVSELRRKSKKSSAPQKKTAKPEPAVPAKKE